MHYILSFFLGLLLGSFPTAYLLVKKKARIDIRDTGSKNVGARNAFEITGSKSIGIIVLITDLLKGFCSVYIPYLFFGNDFWTISFGGFGAVIGHNFSPWLKFKGGRGLATTAGVMIFIGWIFIIIWLIVYLIGQQMFKHIHLSAVIASIISPLFILLVPERLTKTIFLFEIKNLDLFISSCIFCLIIISRHIEPMKEFLQTNSLKNNSDKI